MPITFENDNDVIVYSLEKVIAYARKSQQIFVAQCVWWIASIIGVEQGLVIYIDNIQSRVNVTITLDKVPSIGGAVSPIPRDNQEDRRQDQILQECEEFLQDSQRLQRVERLKSTGIRRSSKAKTYKVTKTARESQKSISKDYGIEEEEIQRRSSSGECLRCAWPSDSKSGHRTADCRRPIKLDKGTATFSKAK
jgi:hypothetical protein